MENDITIDYSCLFQMSDPLANQPLRLTVKNDDEQWKWLISGNADKLFQGESQPLKPIRFYGNSGGNPKDIIWSSIVTMFCVSQKVIDVLIENRITGWGTYPVEIFDRRGNPVYSYYGFSITSNVGNQDVSRSKIITKPPIHPNGKPFDIYKGIYFNESNWDGSDMFRIERAIIVVTKNVMSAFKKAKISNVRFSPVTEEERIVEMFSD